MTEEARQELIDKHYLFRAGDRMQAASGYYNHWPYGRGIFLSDDKKFIMWINEGDHLRIISMEEGPNVQSVFDRFSKGVTAI
jgi:protein-arginine kinase